MISEPLATEARADIEPLGDAFGAIAPEFLIGAFVTSKAWLEANADLARRFAAATIETARYANTNHAATARILADSDKLDPATLAAMTRATFGDTISTTLLAPPLDASVRYGALKTPPDVTALVAAGRPYWSAAHR
jgi:ABC-type nitrate/sulfonate/bicarbonate transport system substrate-binding protein